MLHVPTLLKKLLNMGVIGKTYNWIVNFLSNRTFQVKIGTSFSDKFSLESGTPQGAVISSLLFLIMINDIPQGLDGVEMTLFADDSSIYSGHRNHNKLQNRIQLSLNAIDKWCNKNGFKISISTTVGVLFTKKRRIAVFSYVHPSHCPSPDATLLESLRFDGKYWRHHILSLGV